MGKKKKEKKRREHPLEHMEKRKNYNNNINHNRNSNAMILFDLCAKQTFLGLRFKISQEILISLNFYG